MHALGEMQVLRPDTWLKKGGGYRISNREREVEKKGWLQNIESGGRTTQHVISKT
jgi:hypothetical protein